jgi:hypothetical protein
VEKTEEGSGKKGGGFSAFASKKALSRQARNSEIFVP